MRTSRLASLVLSVAFVFSSSTVSAAEATPAPTYYVPSPNHFAVATPGTQWLNVSRALKPEDLRGRIVLLDFWTYCCVNCLHTLPELAKLEKEFKDDLLVVGVHSAKFDNEKETDNIRQAILRYGVEHPVVNDRDFRIWRTFDVKSWPTLILLKPNGEVVERWVGEGHTSDIRKAVRALRKSMPKKKVAHEKIPVELERDKTSKGEFFYPTKLAFDESTKTLFVTDSSHHQIAAYTWNAETPALLKPAYRIGKRGEAGFKDGSASSARFRRPQGIAVRNGVLYVADTENHAIRKIDLKSKTVSTVAGTGKQGATKLIKPGKAVPKGMPARSTALSSPWDVAFHPDGDHLAIAMAGMHQLWSLDLTTNRLDIIAGTGAEAIDDGLAGTNTLAQPSALGSLLGSLYFLDAESSSLRFYFEGFVRTLVGRGLFDFGMKDGDRKKASLQHPLGLYADVTGVYIADAYNHSIRRYDPKKQELETVVGDGDRGSNANDKAVDADDVEMNEPSAITQLADGRFVIADTNNHRLLFWNKDKEKVERMKIEGEKSSSPVSVPDIDADGKKKLSTRLPNVLESRDEKVNRTNPEVRIVLPEAHHLNDEAPSYARLFEGTPPNEVLKQEWKTADLKKSLDLKLRDLKSGTPYILQGTFYYCLEAKNSVCEIASIEQKILVDSSGDEKVVISIRK